MRSLFFGILVLSIITVSLASSQAIATSEDISQTQASKSGQMLAWKGIKSSILATTPDGEEVQKVIILHPQKDRQLYTGLITFESTRPVEPVIWNVVHLRNETSPLLSGDDDIMNVGRFQIVLSSIEGESSSGSFPFVGNAIELVAPTDEPFIATYALTADLQPYEVMSDLKSLNQLQE